MSTGGTDAQGRRNDSGPGDVAAIDCVPEAHVDELWRAEVANGRETGLERGLGVDGGEDGCIHEGATGLVFVRSRIGRDVGMAIDETWEHGGAGEIDDVSASRDGKVRANRLDPLAL